MKGILIPGGILAAVLGFGWAGLQVRPAPFAPVAQPSGTLDTIALPTDLPAPVARYYRALYGERVPRIRSAVISGRGIVRPLGDVSLPMRYYFSHQAGRSFASHIEVTFFGLPVLNVDESFVNGKGRGTTPFGVDEGSSIDQGANLRLWAETLAWLPAALLTDQRVGWEPIDDASAVLVVPFGALREHIVVRFDPATGMLQSTEVMRFKGAGGAKTLWINRCLALGTLNGHTVQTAGSSTWLDEGRPWAMFLTEDIAYN